MKLTVRSTEGFKAEDRFYYLDLQPGDGFVIRNWAAFRVDKAGETRITATDDVVLTRDGKRQDAFWSAGSP